MWRRGAYGLLWAAREMLPDQIGETPPYPPLLAPRPPCRGRSSANVERDPAVESDRNDSNLDHGVGGEPLHGSSCSLTAGRPV